MDKSIKQRLFSAKNPLLMGLFLILMLGMNGWRFFQHEVQSQHPLDWRQLYAGQLLLEQHENPYVDSAIKKVWIEHVSFDHPFPPPGAPENRLVYPPHAVLIASWILPDNWEESGWIAYTIALLSLLFIPFFAQKIGAKYNPVLALLILFAFRGTFTALVLAQPALLVTFALLAAFRYREKYPLFAGVFLCLAYFKPSLAFPFLLFFLMEKRWQMVLFSISFSLGLYIILWYQTGTALFFEMILGWLHEMKEQAAVVYQAGHGFLNSNMTGIFPAIYAATGLNLSMLEIPLLLLSSGWIIWQYNKKRLALHPTLMLLVLSSLLFSYHLYYDLLILPLLLLSKFSFPKKVQWACLLLFLPWGFMPSYLNVNTLLLILLFVLVYINPEEPAT